MSELTTQGIVDLINNAAIQSATIRAEILDKKAELEALPLFSEIQELEASLKEISVRENELREQAKNTMQKAGIKKFEALDGSVIQLNKKPGALVIESEENIPNDYKTEKVTIVIDKKQLKEDIKEGLIIDGIYISEDYTLVIKR